MPCRPGPARRFTSGCGKSSTVTSDRKSTPVCRAATARPSYRSCTTPSGDCPSTSAPSGPLSGRRRRRPALPAVLDLERDGRQRKIHVPEEFDERSDQRPHARDEEAHHVEAGLAVEERPEEEGDDEDRR